MKPCTSSLLLLILSAAIGNIESAPISSPNDLVSTEMDQVVVGGAVQEPLIGVEAVEATESTEAVEAAEAAESAEAAEVAESTEAVEYAEAIEVAESTEAVEPAEIALVAEKQPEQEAAIEKSAFGSVEPAEELNEEVVAVDNEAKEDIAVESSEEEVSSAVMGPKVEESEKPIDSEVQMTQEQQAIMNEIQEADLSGQLPDAATPFDFPEMEQAQRLQKSGRFGHQQYEQDRDTGLQQDYGFGMGQQEWYETAAEDVTDEYSGPNYATTGRSAFHQEHIEQHQQQQPRQNLYKNNKMTPKKSNKINKHHHISYESSSSYDEVSLGYCQSASLGLIANLRVFGLKYPMNANSVEREMAAKYVISAVNAFPCAKEQMLIKQVMVANPPIYSDRKRFNKWVSLFSKKFLTSVNSPVDLNIDDIIVPFMRK